MSSSSESPSAGSELSSAEVSEEPDARVPVALGEAEGGRGLPVVAVPGDPEDKAPDVRPEEELPAGEPAPDVGVLEPDW